MRLKGRDGMRWEKINIFCTSGTWVGSLLSLLLPCLEKKNPETPCSTRWIFFSHCSDLALRKAALKLQVGLVRSLLFLIQFCLEQNSP